MLEPKEIKTKLQGFVGERLNSQLDSIYKLEAEGEKLAKNMFEGVISKIAHEGDKIALEVQSKEIFHVWITEISFREMGLNNGSKIYLTFKASSVHIL